MCVTKVRNKSPYVTVEGAMSDVELQIYLGTNPPRLQYLPREALCRGQHTQEPRLHCCSSGATMGII